MSVVNQFDAIASEMYAEIRRASAEKRAARKIGECGVMLGVTDRRRVPDMRSDASDWAVWLVKWDGRRWLHVRRLSGNLTYGEVLNAATKWAKELGVARVD